MESQFAAAEDSNRIRSNSGEFFLFKSYCVNTSTS